MGALNQYAEFETTDCTNNTNEGKEESREKDQALRRGG
jgi:hypothetical protein